MTVRSTNDQGCWTSGQMTLRETAGHKVVRGGLEPLTFRFSVGQSCSRRWAATLERRGLPSSCGCGRHRALLDLSLDRADFKGKPVILTVDLFSPRVEPRRGMMGRWISCG